MIRQLGKTLMVAVLCLNMTGAHAADRDSLKEVVKFSDTSNNLQRGSVFVYGDPGLDSLIPVRLLGAVAKAGLYYVPTDTDLMTLLSLAGGITDKAEINKVVFKRAAKGGFEVVNFDLESIMQDTRLESPRIKANDTILIPSERVFVSDNALRIASLVTAVATVFTSVLLAVKR